MTETGGKGRVDRKENGAWLRGRCYTCGHRLRADMPATGCPQCGEAFDGRRDPRRFPEKCACPRCTEARSR